MKTLATAFLLSTTSAHAQIVMPERAITDPHALTSPIGAAILPRSVVEAGVASEGAK